MRLGGSVDIDRTIPVGEPGMLIGASFEKPRVAGSEIEPANVPGGKVWNG